MTKPIDKRYESTLSEHARPDGHVQVPAAALIGIGRR